MVQVVCTVQRLFHLQRAVLDLLEFLVLGLAVVLALKSHL